MQEPEIFEQPVANRDPEARPGTDENGTYGGTVYSNGLGPAVTEDDESGDYHDFVYPEGGPHLSRRLREVNITDTGCEQIDRKLGTWSTAFLIINRVVGSGIYSTPSAIIYYINSVGVTLLFWVVGGIMTFWYDLFRAGLLEFTC
jgi:hypothetical protein